MSGMGVKDNIYKIITLAMLVLIIVGLIIIAATSVAAPGVETPDYGSMKPDNAGLSQNKAGAAELLDSESQEQVPGGTTQSPEEKPEPLDQHGSATEEPDVGFSGGRPEAPDKIILNPIIEDSDGIRIEIEPSGEIKLDPEMFEWENEVTKDRTPAVGVLETTLEASPTEDAVHLDFSMENISGEELELRYGSGQKYDFYVKDADGHEVYRWSHDKGFTMAIIDITMKPGEKMTFSETWDYKDNDGNEAPPGEYFITVVMSASLKSGRPIPFDEISAVQSINVR